MKLLVVASEPVDEWLVDEVSSEQDPDEVRVIAPTLAGSALRYWMNDTDAEIEKAQGLAEKSVERFESAGMSASAEPVGDDQPSISIDDALRTFEPDRVIVIKHAEDEQAYREDEVISELIEVTDVPIDVRVVASGG